jgi:glyoxylase-like metal-dependent hydrolase (beta-lactamase superfamily II)
MMCVRLTGGGKTAFFTADLIPTAAHVPYPWIMGYDLYPLTTLDSKKKWIPQAAGGEWLVIFGHEARTPAGYLRERQGRYELEPVMIDV